MKTIVFNLLLYRVSPASKHQRTYIIKDESEESTHTYDNSYIISTLRMVDTEAMVAAKAPAQDAKYPLPVTTKGPRNVTKQAMTIQRMERLKSATMWSSTRIGFSLLSSVITRSTKAMVMHATTRAKIASSDFSSLTKGIDAISTTKEETIRIMCNPASLMVVLMNASVVKSIALALP